MKRPSHLEMAGWGLASMLGAWVLVFKTDFGFGLPAFLVGLSIAAGRVSNSVTVALRTVMLLTASTFILLGIVAALFETDMRLDHPVTAPVLPAVHMRANPAPGNVRKKLYFASVWCALVCAMTVRSSLGCGGMMWAVVRSVVVFGIAMAVHLKFATDWVTWEPKNAHYPKMLHGAVVSVYTLMPVYAGYFVALFWDVAGKEKKTGLNL